VASSRELFLYETIWHLFVIAVILFVPAAIVYSESFWTLPGLNTPLVLLLVVAYVIALLLGTFVSRRCRYPRFLAMTAATAAALSAVYLAVLLQASPRFSRLLLLISTSCMVVGLLAPAMVGMSTRRLRQLLGSMAGLSVALGVGSLVARPELDNSNRREQSERIIRASQQTLSATYYTGYLRDAALQGTGGAITADPAGGGYFLVLPRGAIYRVSWDSGGQMDVEQLPQRVPINNAEFEAAVDETVPKAAFRVADILALRVGDTTTLYASHHYWKDSERCFVVRLSALSLPARSESRSGAAPQWKTVFESKPCLPVGLARGLSFAGEQVGGNLEAMPDGSLLLTLGDHQFDGWYHSPDLIQDRSSDYGKTMRIDTVTGAASLFTLGHRNPEGLTVDGAGRIWETEHGPQGGDELNQLQLGGNYGYPDRTFGTEYGSVTWPVAKADGAKGYIDPVFAWVPSIGISDLVSVNDDAFSRWRSDLLIASLAGRALWRVRLEESRVVYAEPIKIGERIRDIAVGPGEFVLWSDSGTIIRVRPADSIDDGAVLFTASCGGCHDDLDNRIGPTLGDVLDRPVASAPGYLYSSALRSVGGYWSDDRLDAFLTNPAAFAPGTTMSISGLSAKSRKLIIEYLKYFYEPGSSIDAPP
jgi:cytochrome c2